MAKLIKRIAGAISLVLLIAIIAVVSLPFIIDPNDFKEEIQNLAADQGVDLSLGGPISWQFFPTIGLSINELKVAPINEPEQTLAQVREATAAVALLPLLKRQIRIDTLMMDGATINLTVDRQGRGNWQAFSSSAPASSTPTPDPSSPSQDTNANTALDLTVKTISLKDASLVYDDQQSGQRSELRDLNLSITDVNLDQRPFPLSLSVEISNPALTVPLRVALTSQLQINNALTEFAVNDGTLSLTNAGVELTLAAHASTDPALKFDGKLNVDIGDSEALFKALGIDKPTTADPSVLAKIQFASAFRGSDTKVDVEELKLVLDDTTLGGTLGVQFPTDQQLLSLSVNLAGDRLDLDRYLPPPTDTETDATVATSEAVASEDAPLPLDSLRAINATVQATFNELVVSKMPIAQLDFSLKGKAGLWQLEKFNANFYQGKLTTRGELDARPTTALMKFNAAMSGLAVQPLLVDLADVDAVSGTVEMRVDGNTRASSIQQIIDNLTATANFTGDSLLIKGFNVEQSYCQMVTQIPNGDAAAPSSTDAANKSWANETTINGVDGQLIFANSNLDIKKLQAQIAYLVLAAKGNANLKNEHYEVSMPLRLTQEKTSENGCLVTSKFLIDREVNVIGCEGSLAPMDFAEQCGLRSGAVGDLAKQALRYNVEKKVSDEKVDEKKQEVRKKAKDKLMDLLRR